MANNRTALPDLMPILSRGKHRSPRRGACFMELASYLAGEAWSDHPACTHPLLAGLARGVNDYTSDEGRPHLAGLIPSVIGLTSDDPRVYGRIAVRSAIIALPVVAAERQRVMAVSVLACERALALHDGRGSANSPAQISDASREALRQVPHAAEWAKHFSRAIRTSNKSFIRHGAPSIVRYAVEGVAYATVPDPDAILRELLVAAIRECGGEPPAGQKATPAGVAEEQWAAACRLTRA